MNGRARGTRVKEFDSAVGSITGDYSAEQKRLLSFLRASGFGDLQILRPSGAYPSDNGLQIDLEVLKDGKMVYAPELMRAFLNLSRVLKYGLVIFATAPILRIDMTMTNGARAVGLNDGKYRSNRDADYSETLQTLQAFTYGYTGDGTETDWPKFWQDQEAAAEKRDWLELVADIADSGKSIARYALFGAGLYLLNKLAPFAQLAGMIVKASKKKRGRR